MIRTAPALPLALLLLLGACVCPPAPDVLRYADQDLATPETAIEYFRAAMERRDAYHQLLCFSDELKRKNPDLTLANLQTFQGRVHEFIEEKVGSIDAIEVEEVIIDEREPWQAQVVVASGSRHETIVMTLEVGYEVVWEDSSRSSGTFPPGSTNPARLQAGKVIVELSLRRALSENPGRRANEIHRLTLERDWKIRGIKGGDFSREMEQFLRDQKEALEPAPPPPPRS